MNSTHRGSVILAIDPGTRLMGVAVLDGRRLVYHGVKTLHAVGSPKWRLEEARRVILRLIRNFRPHILAVETAFFAQDRNAAFLNVLIEEIQSLARERRIEVRSLAPSTVRKRLCGNGRATKREVADVVAAWHPELKVYLTKDQWWKERYYGNMFDAVAVGLACQRSLSAASRTPLEVSAG